MNKTQFQQKIAESDKPVIVDFWASWCPPCMITKPVLEKLAKEYAERIHFLPINADDSREVMEMFRVYGIPTVITFRGGKEVGRVTGAQGENGYRAMFESLASGKEVRIPLTRFDRMLRIGAGGFFLMFGISNGSWLLAGIGALVAFMGVHDQFPLLDTLTGTFKRK
jgi:thioredoxin 1